MRLLLLDYQSMLQETIRAGSNERSSQILSYIGKLLSLSSPLTPGERSASTPLPEPLSEREREILQPIAMGRSNLEIAKILVIALSTVKTHINNLYGKLGASRRTEAIAIARELGLLAD